MRPKIWRELDGWHRFEKTRPPPFTLILTSTPSNLALPRRRIGSWSLYLRVSGVMRSKCQSSNSFNIVAFAGGTSILRLVVNLDSLVEVSTFADNSDFKGSNRLHD